MQKRGIVVINLPYFFGNNDLYDLFCKCGKIDNYMVLKTGPIDTLHDGGIVIFQNELSVEFALNMNESVVGGQCIHVFPITDDLLEPLYKLNIPFFRDPNAPVEPAKLAPVSTLSSVQDTMETSSGKEEKVVSLTKLRMSGLKTGVTEKEIRDGCAMVKGLVNVVILNPRKHKDGIIAMLEFHSPELRDIAFKKLRKCVINDTVVTVKAWKERPSWKQRNMMKEPNSSDSGRSVEKGMSGSDRRKNSFDRGRGSLERRQSIERGRNSPDRRTGSPERGRLSPRNRSYSPTRSRSRSGSYDRR